MTSYFVDTSAIAKRYLTKEVGAVWVASWAPVTAGNVIIITNLTVVEMSSLLARRARDGSLTKVDATTLKNLFLFHVRKEYLSFQLEDALLYLAGNLADKYNLRALDSIQLAGALTATSELNEPLTFISADNNLLAAASGEGFKIDNPNSHP